MIAPIHFTTSIDRLHQQFLELLPRIETHARLYFRGTTCRDKRRDQIAETIALAWRWFRRLADRGIDAMQFPSAIAGYAALAVASGRRAVGMECAKDVMSSRCQRRHGFTVEPLSSTRRCHEDLYGTVNGQRLQDVYEERLRDNTRTPPDEQAGFRCDFADWLQTLTSRERRLVVLMSMNERTKDLARRFGLSAGRISQMRRSLCADWQHFTGDVETAAV